jgi:hypothetical protein
MPQQWLMQQECNQTAQSTEYESVSTITHSKQMKSSQAKSQTKTNQNHKLYGVRSRAVLMALEQYGNQSRAELEQSAGISKDLISAIVSRLNKRGARIGKQIHIVSYVYDAEGARRYPRAVYAIGDGEDAKKPKASPKENRRRYDAKRVGFYRMNSVFNLGKSRDQIRAESKTA